VEDKPCGRGGFGAVFEAFDERLNRKQPIKRILGKCSRQWNDYGETSGRDE